MALGLNLQRIGHVSIALASVTSLTVASFALAGEDLDGQVQAALPSVAVNDSGIVAVLYDTFDGFSGAGFPIFSAHLAVSRNQGSSFTDQVLETFLSPTTDNGNGRQRVLGDYQQLKAVGNTFFGVFTGNGVPFGRPFANMDAIFLKTSVP